MIRVIKLGGSLHDAPQLAAWLGLLGEGGGQVVLVPGGGPFADQVRAAQQRLGFDDATAHHMALLAMEQYGLLLCGLDARLRPAASREDIHAALAGAATPVWLPSRLCLAQPDIPASWAVTSDSLALWLAGHLGAAALGLVKSRLPEPGLDAPGLARAGLVDEAFPAFMARWPMPLRVFSREDVAGCRTWLGEGPGKPGSRQAG
ncbi:MAG: amino acid kinase [Pseudomonadota bacterium]